MADFVVQDALANVWCSPNQDRIVITKPIKISAPYGAFLTVQVLWLVYPLPSNDAYYFVYQIGQAPAGLFNLPTTPNVWMRASDICQSQNMVIHLHNENGIRFPLDQAYFRINSDNNLILAIRNVPEIPTNFATLDLHIQLYSNSYFNSPRWTQAKTIANLPNAPAIQYTSAVIGNTNDIYNFRNAVAAMLSATVSVPAVLYNKNGRFYSNLSGPNDIAVGDYVEALVDASIRSVYTFPLTGMIPFTSTLDTTERKRVFPPTPLLDTIDYKDDVDFFMVGSTVSSQLSNGLYYNQDSESCVRMLTHNAYALQDTQIQSMLANDTVFHTEPDVQFAALVRNSGYQRSIVNVGNRINDLYRLTQAQIIQAMGLVPSTLPEWQAASLEASAYTAIMGEWDYQVTEAQVESAYGYNCMTQRFCYPYPTFGLEQQGLLEKTYVEPIGLQDSVPTTYDNNGQMVAYANGTPEAIQLVPLPNGTAVVVELTPGRIYNANEASRYIGLSTVVVTTPMTQTGFRAYVSPLSAGQPTNQWLDVTANTGHLYTLSADGLTLTWDTHALAISSYYPAVVIGDEVLMYPVPLDPVYPGFVRFDITANQWILPAGAAPGTPPTLGNATVTIPPGRIELFMDGSPLMHGIDFVVQWPQIVVIKQPTEAVGVAPSIVARVYGFCNSDMSMDLPRESGFVTNGILSGDTPFRVRNDRNLRIVVGGALRLKASIPFGEDQPTLVASSPLNGLPYTVEDIVMPTQGFTSQETYAYRAVSMDMDTRVSEYLTGLAPKTVATGPNPILQLYNLYSPFMSALITGFMNNTFLNTGELSAAYTNLQVAGWVAPLTYLLAYDPCLNPNLDMRYVYIRPHSYPTVVTITQAQFTFLETIIRDYLTIQGLPARLDLSSYVSISG